MTQITGKVESYKTCPDGSIIVTVCGKEVTFPPEKAWLKEKYPVGQGVDVFHQNFQGTVMKPLGASTAPAAKAKPPQQTAGPKTPSIPEEVTGEYSGASKGCMVGIKKKGGNGAISMYRCAPDYHKTLLGPDCPKMSGHEVKFRFNNEGIVIEVIPLSGQPQQKGPAPEPAPVKKVPTAKEILEENLKNATLPPAAAPTFKPEACKKPACADLDTYECCPDLACHIITEKVRGKCCDLLGQPCNQIGDGRCPLEEKTTAAPGKQPVPCTSPAQAPATSATGPDAAASTVEDPKLPTASDKDVWGRECKEFKDLLLGTKREGIERLLDWLEKETDFLIAPSSTKFHDAVAGGLLHHSLKVYHNLVTLSQVFDQDYPPDSLVIIALLHDVCKANFYTLVKKSLPRRKENGDLEFDDWGKKIWDETLVYEVDDKFPLGHGERSVILVLQAGLKLTDLEIMGIRWHMMAFDDLKSTYAGNKAITAASDKYRIIPLVHIADLSASFLEMRQPKTAAAGGA